MGACLQWNVTAIVGYHSGATVAGRSTRQRLLVLGIYNVQRGLCIAKCGYEAGEECCMEYIFRQG